MGQGRWNLVCVLYGRGIQLLGSRILNFGSCTVEVYPKLQSVREWWPTRAGWLFNNESGWILFIQIIFYWYIGFSQLGNLFVIRINVDFQWLVVTAESVTLRWLARAVRKQLCRSRYGKSLPAARCCQIASDLTNFTGDRQIERHHCQVKPLILWGLKNNLENVDLTRFKRRIFSSDIY